MSLLYPARGAVTGSRHRSSSARPLSQDQSDGRFARHPAQCGEAAMAAGPRKRISCRKKDDWALSGFAGWPPENPPTGRLKGVSVRKWVWAPAREPKVPDGRRGFGRVLYSCRA